MMTAEVEEVAVALTLLLEGAIAGDIGHCTPLPSPYLSNHSEDSVNSMEEKTEKVSGNGVRRAPPPSLDGGARQVACQALACLAHIFTWAPLHCDTLSELSCCPSEGWSTTQVSPSFTSSPSFSSLPSSRNLLRRYLPAWRFGRLSATTSREARRQERLRSLAGTRRHWLPLYQSC